MTTLSDTDSQNRSDHPKNSLTKVLSGLKGGAMGPFIGLILLCVFFSLQSPYFLSLGNGLNILDQVTMLGIVAIGMTMVIILGGIDLSVGSVLAFSMMMMGWLQQYMDVPLAMAALIGILAGALCGLFSGLLIVSARLPAFIATLATMSIARGLAQILTDGRQIVGYSDWFTNLSTFRIFGIFSTTMLIFLFLALICWFFLQYRASGRDLYAIGGSAEVARLSGINVKLKTLAIYVIAGALSAVAGLTLAARLDSSQPNAGMGLELDAIAAVVIGGASLNGGVGGMAGTMVGIFIIGVLRNGLNLLGISPFVQSIIIGFVIAIAVAFDTLGRKKS
jgi:ribose transport system permease protein